MTALLTYHLETPCYPHKPFCPQCENTFKLDSCWSDCQLADTILCVIPNGRPNQTLQCAGFTKVLPAYLALSTQTLDCSRTAPPGAVLSLLPIDHPFHNNTTGAVWESGWLSYTLGVAAPLLIKYRYTLTKVLAFPPVDYCYVSGLSIYADFSAFCGCPATEAEMRQHGTGIGYVSGEAPGHYFTEENQQIGSAHDGAVWFDHFEVLGSTCEPFVIPCTGTIRACQEPMDGPDPINKHHILIITEIPET